MTRKHLFIPLLLACFVFTHKLQAQTQKVYTLAAGLSLLVFYALAMQCMSTLAVVKRETHSWKWPIIMLLYMTGLAYVMSFITFHLFK